MDALLQGALLGLAVAAPPGPNAAICMSRTLAAGPTIGFRCGLGVASAHALYAALAVIGVDRASGLFGSGRSTLALHLAGGFLLVAYGLRLGRTPPAPSPRASSTAYLTTLAVGLGNPVTILYFAAVMATGAIPSGAGAVVVVGVFIGSAAWWGALTSVTAAVHHRLDERRLGWANRLTASAIGGCGVMTVVTAL